MLAAGQILSKFLFSSARMGCTGKILVIVSFKKHNGMKNSSKLHPTFVLMDILRFFHARHGLENMVKYIYCPDDLDLIYVINILIS